MKFDVRQYRLILASLYGLIFFSTALFVVADDPSPQTRNVRSDQLSITEHQSHLTGTLVTRSTLEGKTTTSAQSIPTIVRTGNRISFQADREFQGRRFRASMHGIVSEKSLIGWSCSEFGGAQRDTAWRAEKAGDASANNQAANAVGEFADVDDLGNPKLSGRTLYRTEDQTYELSGAGKNMWASNDQCHFAWRKMKGDFILDCQAQWLSEGVDPHRKFGWMIRSSLDADAIYADVAVHGDGLTSLQYRTTVGGNTEQIRSERSSPNVLRLTRKGREVSMEVAKFGEQLEGSKPIELDLGEEVYVGLFVCSHNEEIVERAAFTNVRITAPAPIGFRPYRDYIGSRLEILNVNTGTRRVIHTANDSFQAPNWTSDGKSLIFNRNGRLYRFTLQTSEIAEIDTAFATRNNNDHVISPDGRSLAISHHSAEHYNQSMVYTVGIQGGTPKLVTSKGPSYLHGWSPDDRWLLYTGQRGTELDIYRIPIAGGEEERLTDAQGVDDGAEYSPDGKRIVFNSTRTGKMQLWQMNSDGSEQARLHSSETNDWFPHISPNGKTIVFLSYTDEVEATDHPFYKRVVLQKLVDGKATIIGYVYGGQGSINVNSWSPDNEHIAFVSNSQLPLP